jgi:hypothetical protein
VLLSSVTPTWPARALNVFKRHSTSLKGEIGNKLCRIIIACRFPGAYPCTSANVRLANAVHIEDHELENLSGALVDMAQRHAEDGETVGFALYDFTSAWLRNIDPLEAQVRHHLVPLLDTAAPADSQETVAFSGLLQSVLPSHAAWKDPGALAAAGMSLRADAEARDIVLDAIQQACASHGAVHMQSSVVRLQPLIGLQGSDQSIIAG